MGIFDPKVDVNLAPERTIPVPQVSNVGGMEAATTVAQGLGGFAAALLGGLGGSGRSSSGTTPTQQNRLQFMKDYQRVQQIQDSGQRQRMQRQLYVNASAMGVDTDWMNEVHHTATGQPVDLGVANMEEQRRINFVNNPENVGFFLAAEGKLGPDATPDQIAETAMTLAAADTQRDAIIADRNLTATEAEPAAIQKIQGASDLFLGTIQNKVKNGQPITDREIAAARAGLAQTNELILTTGPLGQVKESERQAYNDAYKLQLGLLDVYEQFTLSNLADQQVNQLAAGVTKSIMDSGLSPIEKMGLLNELKRGGLETMVQYNIISVDALTEKLPQIAKAVNLNGLKVDTTNMGAASTETGKAAGVDKQHGAGVQQEIVNIDKEPTATVDRIDATTLLLEGQTLNREDTATQQEALKEQLTILPEAWIKLGDKDKQWFSAQKTNANNFKIVRAIEELAKTDPLAAATAADKMAQATAAMSQSARFAQQSALRDGTFKVVDGEIVFDMEALVASLDLNSIDQQKLEDAANKYYGGDIGALIADKGSKTPPVGTLGMRDGLFITLGDRVANETKMSQIKDQMDAIQALDKSSNVYLELSQKYGMPAPFNELSPPGSTGRLQGGLEPDAGTVVPVPMTGDGTVAPLTSGDTAPDGLPTDSFQAPEAGATEAPVGETTVTPEQAIAPTEGVSEGQQAITEATTPAAPAAPASRADITKAARVQAAEEGYQEGTPAFTARSSALQRQMLKGETPEAAGSTPIMNYAPTVQASAPKGNAHRNPVATKVPAEAAAVQAMPVAQRATQRVNLKSKDERASYAMQGMVDRGLPEHIAHGFVLNMLDESNLDPGINEKNPVVPGSRGGFGTYQLTGPRRRDYEAWAQKNGFPLDSMDAQLDWLMYELQTSEKAAWTKIQQAKTVGEAAELIVRHFLRPAKEHRESRAKKYRKHYG